MQQELKSAHDQTFAVATALPMELLQALQKLVSDWTQKAGRAFSDAESETDECGKRLIEHGAMCRFNCAESLKEVLKNYAQPKEESPLKDQT